ncbi:MAG: glutaredoxin family protein [Candidatus Thiodiazotropha sp.]
MTRLWRCWCTGKRDRFSSPCGYLPVNDPAHERHWQTGPVVTGARQVRFYHREGCHLCDDMRELLGELQHTHGFGVTEVDVDQDADLKQRFGQRIPLLLGAQGECLSEYYLDPKRLLSYLQGP